MNQGRSWFRMTVLALGFAFLYIPIASLVFYSFNKSRLVTVWGGFSTKWYGELLRNEQILNAAWLSLKVAAISATLAVVLGTLAGMVLARFGPFKGRTLFSGLTTAPLVMPEVITGLSLLLLFVTMEQIIGWPQGPRHDDHHHRAHHFHDGVRDRRRAVAPRADGRFARGSGDGPGRAPAQGVLPHHAADHRAGAHVRLAACLHAVAR